jgi:hypothetical protein
MPIRRVLAITIYVIGVVMVIIGVLPKFQGGHFRRDFLLGGATVIAAAGAAFRRRRTVPPV